MKKTILLGAVLAAFAGAAAAQSSVTLFGVIDANVRSAKSGNATIKQVSSDGLNSSRLGVRGSEDLGGGLKASFWLEGAFSPDTGAADSSRFWGRRATVSLSSTEFGELRIGRHKVAARLLIDGFTPYETTGIAEITKAYSAFGSGADTLNRADNQVAYSLPENLGGVYGTFELGAGEAADGKKYSSARLGYKTKELNVAGAYAQTDAKGSKYKLSVLGASYDFGAAVVMATVANTKFNAYKQSIFTIGAKVPVTKEGAVRVHYARSDANDAAALAKVADDLNILSFGYVHDISKRTALYATYSQIDNKGNSKVTIAGAPAAAAGQKSSAYEVGVRHSF